MMPFGNRSSGYYCWIRRSALLLPVADVGSFQSVPSHLFADMQALAHMVLFKCHKLILLGSTQWSEREKRKRRKRDIHFVLFINDLNSRAKYVHVS